MCVQVHTHIYTYVCRPAHTHPYFQKEALEPAALSRSAEHSQLPIWVNGEQWELFLLAAEGFS